MKGGHMGDTEMIDTTTKHGSPTLHKQKSKPKTDEEVKKGHCTHGPQAKCINCLGVTKENVKDIKHSCKHPPTQKCPNCVETDKDNLSAKHESFEHYISEMKAKCKGKHKPDQKCHNCTAVQQYSYKVNYNCPSHKPFPEGMCNKCLPSAVVL